LIQNADIFCPLKSFPFTIHIFIPSLHLSVFSPGTNAPAKKLDSKPIGS
jgi:hypothetical protein